MNRQERVKKYGFNHKENQSSQSPFKPFSGAHDDGVDSLFCYGGIGAGNFGRDLSGHFSRWHLECATHRQLPLNAPRFSIRIKNDDKIHIFQLGNHGFENPLPVDAREVNVLFPYIIDNVKHIDLPVEFSLLSFSPIIPHDYHASSLPVVFFEFEVKNNSLENVDFDVAFFWPNILNWESSQNRSDSCSTLLQYPSDSQIQKSVPTAVWTDRINFGKQSKSVEVDNFAKSILYTTNKSANQNMSGSCFLGVQDDDLSRSSIHSCMRCTNWENSNNEWTEEAIEKYFFENGNLGNSLITWESVGEEVTGGAISGGLFLKPNECKKIKFILSWDIPIVETGSGRKWYKKYTEYFNTTGNNAVEIAQYAFNHYNDYLSQIDSWHSRELEKSDLPDVLAGMKINELYYIVDGGSVWVAKEAKNSDMTTPRLGNCEHFAILEGFDFGYYYLSTFDLWPYALEGFLVHFPRLAELVIEDYMKAINIEILDERIFYKLKKSGNILLKDKIPHDVGQILGDPWNKLNDYQINIDSNVWKDHNPMFIISTYITLQKIDKLSIDERTWELIKRVARFAKKQDRDNDGLPEHDSFGDSTFDAVEIAGPALFSSSLSVTMWHILANWSHILNDVEATNYYQDLAKKSEDSYIKHFWNGKYFFAETSGVTKEWVLTDGLFGFLLADKAKIKLGIPKLFIQSHLQTVYVNNFQKFNNGELGLVLQSPLGGWDEHNGGVQMDEVLVGAAWSCISLMKLYELQNEAIEIALKMYSLLYKSSGLQFRSPAAWNRKKEFRAPLNLRPMAIEYLN